MEDLGVSIAVLPVIMKYKKTQEAESSAPVLLLPFLLF